MNFSLECKNKFWFENITQLFCNIQIIPLPNMTLADQLNAMTRFVIIVFLCMLIFGNSKSSFIFLILSLLFIIILYYIQKTSMNNNNKPENYQYEAISIKGSNNLCNYNSCTTSTCKKTNTTLVPTDMNALTNNYLLSKNSSINNTQPGCKDEFLISSKDFVSLNQKLAGPANPKTKIPPIIVAPPMDLDYWRANNLINHSHINVESQHDEYLSGYKVSNCCDNIDACLVPIINKSQKQSIEHYKPLYEGITDKKHPVRPSCSAMQKDIKNPIKAPELVTTSFKSTIENYCGREQLPKNPNPVPIQSPVISTSSYHDIIEPFEYPHALPNESGWVNTSCGYNSNQIFDSNLPSNLQAGNCDLTPQMKNYNKNLFTQYIQPDTFTRNEIIEPINSNIGISFTQQFEPKTCSRDENGLTYVEHDPRIFSKDEKNRELDIGITEYNIYDPRFSGYGTSYRAYTDKDLGQTKFYYDDINAIRMPNYLVRSNIDFAQYADTYGPLSDKNKHGSVYTNNIRALAQDSFLRSSIEQRESLSESLMRKRNGELWQTRKYPMRTFGGASSRAS